MPAILGLVWTLVAGSILVLVRFYCETYPHVLQNMC